jgi:hypothetical protein
VQGERGVLKRCQDGKEEERVAKEGRSLMETVKNGSKIVVSGWTRWLGFVSVERGLEHALQHRKGK